VGSFFDQVRELAPCVRTPPGFVGYLVDPAERHCHHMGRPIGARVSVVEPISELFAVWSRNERWIRS
jgi:hypothetical protein